MIKYKFLIVLSAFVFLSCNCIVAKELSSLDEDTITKIDALIQEGLETCNTPGAAVSIVVGGEVVLTKGYGLRNIDDELPVTENTLFPIASCSKAFTTFALGQMVDEGDIAWYDPVVKYIPEFYLMDSYATRHVTIRDLVTHQSGLPRHDLVWDNSDLSREDLLSRLRYLEPASELREYFQYNNLMYAVAGLLIERITGKTWEETVQSHIFNPLEMDQSNFFIEETQESNDFALPYSKKEEGVEVTSFLEVSNIGPAISINSSAKDMAKWVRLQLSSGVVDDKYLIHEAFLKEMHTVQVAMPSYPSDGPYTFGYGLGWMTGFYKGHYVLKHGGNVDGFTSCVLMLPKEDIGVVILSNSGWNEFATDYSYKIADCIVDVKKESKIAVDDYVGEFEHKGYGTVQVCVSEEKLVMIFNGRGYVLKRKSHDSFISSIGEDVKCAFIRNASGKVFEFRIVLEPSSSPIVFRKKIARELFSEEYLKQFEGKYESSDTSIILSLEKENLIATIPRSRPYKLIPKSPLQFSVKGRPNASIQFILGEDEQVEEVLFIQLGETVSFKPS